MTGSSKGPGIKQRKILFLGAALIVLLAGGLLLYSYFKNPRQTLKPETGLEGIDWEHEVARHFNRDIVNILMLGFDRTASRDQRYRLYRPDAIMIVSLNFKAKRATLVSIPRDSYVKISATEGYDKINSAYMYGYEQLGSEGNRHQSGLNTVLSTVQDFLGGVPVHYFVKLDMDSLEEIVDQLGGVDYDVEVQVREPGSDDLLLDKGKQHLNGRQFLDYVRFRGVDGDFARIERQQNIVVSAFFQLKEAGKLTDLPDIIKTLTQQVETNLTLPQMVALALFGRELNENKINSLAFPGYPQYASREGQEIFYLVINEKARIEIIKLVFGVTVEENPQIVLPGRTDSSQPPPPSGEVQPPWEPISPHHSSDFPSEEDYRRDN